MSFQAVEDWFLKQMIHVWTDPNLGNQPAGSFTVENKDLKTPTTWARFSIQNMTTGQDGMGSNYVRYDRYSDATVQIFVPLNTGTKESNMLADAFVEYFEGRQFYPTLNLKDIDIHILSVIPTKERPDESWFRQDVTINYRWFINK